MLWLLAAMLHTGVCAWRVALVSIPGVADL